MKNINTIIFDLGGVLFNINYQNTINEFKKLGVKNIHSFYSEKLQNKLFDQLETGKISNSDFINKIKCHCNIKEKDKILSAWNAMLIGLPENNISLLKKIQKKYDQIFLLSNINAIHLSKIKELVGSKKYINFEKLFKKVYYSHKIGYRKPDEKAFEIILSENNLNKNEVLFVDDSIQHIKSAKEMGINTYHLLKYEKISSEFAELIL